MKKTFISVPVKLLTLVIGTLLVLSLGFTTLSVWRLQDRFVSYQQDKLTLGKTQFHQQQDSLRDQLRIWIESFIDVTNVTEHRDFSQLTQAMKQQFYSLQLHLNVENFWVIDENLQTLSSSEEITSPLIRSNVSQVLKNQEPLSFVSCGTIRTDCLLIISVPVLNQQGDIAVITISATFVDLLFTLNQSLNNDVAIIKLPANSDQKLDNIEIISTSNNQVISKIVNSEMLSNLSATQDDTAMEFDGDSYYYLVNFLPLSSNSNVNYYLLLIDDVIAFKHQNEMYRNYFLVGELIIFTLLSIVVFMITAPFTQRLINLADALPLLAKKEFNQFRAIKLQKNSKFTDELDLLTKSAQDLSFELEELNIEVEQKTKELENIAMYDILTGLPNRNMLNHQLHKSVANIHDSEHSIAILFLDLDDFKKVNDSHGHVQGDKLLEEAARRIRTCISKRDLACRFGGDEFVILLNQVEDIEQVISLAEDILQRFKEPIRVGSGIFYVTTSIGIVLSKDQLTRPDDLISYADIAMYEAKANGGSQYYIYHEEMFQRVATRVALEGEVRQALLKKQFSLALQPQLQTRDNKLYGFEALIRWNHPSRGLVPPDEFLPIMENSEYMLELGYWVIQRCFELAVELREPLKNKIKIAINLSACQFLDPHLPDYLAKMVKQFDIKAHHFELELTEQTLVSDIDKATQAMQHIKSMGFGFAIDDFGTGYSSLAYIKKMPVDVIKIDKSFIFGMLENHSDYQIIISTIAMVKNLGLQVVAEGVETSAQLRSLTENDCDIIQGYYFSKPIPENEVSLFIEEQIVDGQWKTLI